MQQSAGNSVAVSALAEAKVIDPKVPDFGFVSRNMVAEVSAVAVTADGARFTRQAIVRIKALPEANEAPYEILTWDASGTSSVWAPPWFHYQAKAAFGPCQ